MIILQSNAQLLNSGGGGAGTLPTTDGEMLPKSLRVQPVPEFFVENLYLVSTFFFHFRAFWKPCPREISYVGNVANLKNMTVCIVKYDLIEPKIIFRGQIHEKARQGT